MNPKFVVLDTSLDADAWHTILGGRILTYDLISRIIVSGTYLLYYLMQESKIWCADFYLDGGVLQTIWGHFDLDIDFCPHF